VFFSFATTLCRVNDTSRNKCVDFDKWLLDSSVQSGKIRQLMGLELVVFRRPLARFPVRKCKILNGTTNYQLCARQGKTGNSSRISNEPLSRSYKRVVRCSAMEPCYQERLIGSHLTALVACNAPFAAMIFARLPLLSPLSDHLRGWSYFRFGSIASFCRLPITSGLPR